MKTIASISAGAFYRPKLPAQMGVDIRRHASARGLSSSAVIANAITTELGQGRRNLGKPSGTFLVAAVRDHARYECLLAPALESIAGIASPGSVAAAETLDAILEALLQVIRGQAALSADVAALALEFKNAR